jgi:hypothetical protein
MSNKKIQRTQSEMTSVQVFAARESSSGVACGYLPSPLLRG